MSDTYIQFPLSPLLWFDPACKQEDGHLKSTQQGTLRMVVQVQTVGGREFSSAQDASELDYMLHNMLERQLFRKGAQMASQGHQCCFVA